MADFVAVLKKTIEGLSENTPEVRAKVYAKARATIDAKLAAINPPPPAAVVERQRAAIEDAIAAVEQSYAPSPMIEDDELDSFFGNYTPEPDEPAGTPSTRAEAPVYGGLPKVDAFSGSGQGEIQRTSDPHGQGADDYPGDDGADDGIRHGESDEDLSAVVDDDESRQRAYLPPARRARRGVSGGLIAAVLALVVIGGGAYAAWMNQDALSGMLGLAGTSEVAEGTDQADDAAANNTIDDVLAENDAATSGETDVPGLVTPEDGETDVAALAPDEQQPAETDTSPAGGIAAPEPTRKYTQRLQADGTESDPGPADGGLSIGEGTSVAELTQTAQAETGTVTDVPATTPTGPNNGTGTSSPQSNRAVAVGQRSIFYEERTSTAAATAENGSIVWSVVQESPGGDAPPEPAIRAEANIPGKDLQLRMTIRRNADPTLPASHIMEMIFLTPEGFEGGGIQNVVRVAMKDSEQATGSPLLGIPARIADGFFLVALSDSPAEIQANMTLLRRQDWIDVPLIYSSGRRALITMEKGVPGERVFEEVMKAWQDASSG